MQILLVEDNDTVREAFKDTLESLNYKVYEAQDGRDALGLIRNRDVRFDLVVSDMVMPHMNGLQLYEALEETHEDVRMLIITGYPMPGAGESLAERPGVRWAQKPVPFEQLRRLVREMLEGEGQNGGSVGGFS